MSDVKDIQELFSNLTKSIDVIHDRIKDKVLKETGKTINLCWGIQSKFKAKASKIPNKEIYEIYISDGAIDNVIKKSVEFIRKIRNKSFLSFIDETSLEKDLSFLDKYSGGQLNERIIKTSILWIYYHELSHIYQCHFDVSNYQMHTLFNINEFFEGQLYVSRQDAGSSRDSVFSHIFEFSADSEATFHTVTFLASINNGVISKETIWCFFVSMTLVFNVFYELSGDHISRKISGSHPDAAIRLRLIFKAVYHLVSKISPRKHVPWANSNLDVFTVAIDAMKIVLFSILNEEGRIHPTMYYDSNVLRQQGEVDVYAIGLFEAYKLVYPIIKSKYFGNLDSGILLVENVDEFC